MPHHSALSRRAWLASAAASVCSLRMLNAAVLHPDMAQPVGRFRGRLQTRPHAARRTTTIPGESPLGIGKERDGLRYVPAGYSGQSPFALVLMLHGASGTPTSAMRPLRALADAAGFVLLAPASRQPSWDIRYGAFGPDVDFIDAALDQTFDECNVDPSRVFIAGFSDGASYALSLGLSNGGLFKRVVAFSPGFSKPGEVQGKPPVFISHGTRDPILDIDQTSRRIVPDLRAKGYAVTYKEFDGVHQVPPGIASAAKDWLLAT